MSINHHPDNATLMAYSAGTLDEAFAIVVSCHLETCSSCRSTFETMRAMGGASLENCETVDTEAGAFGRVLEKISAADAANGAGQMQETVSVKADFENTPNALSTYLDEDISQLKWKRMGPSVWQYPIQLSKDANSSLRLLRIAPGKSVPDHGHNGQEITMILSGAYKDEIGYFGPGDVADLDEHIEHQPFVASDEDCICLAATEAPTKFKGLAGKILQPIFGI